MMERSSLADLREIVEEGFARSKKPNDDAYALASMARVLLVRLDAEARPTPVEPEARLHEDYIDGQALVNQAASVSTYDPKWGRDVISIESLRAIFTEMKSESPRLAVEPDGLPLDVERLARGVHAERNYAAPFGSNECDCRERARRIVSMIPAGFTIARFGAPSEDEQPR